MNNKKYIRDEILFLIARYQNEVRGLSGSIEEADGLEKDTRFEAITERRRRMKYEIRIDQPGKYGTETIKGEFDNGSEAEEFVETVMEHFQNVTVEITAVASNVPDEEGADE